MKRLSEAVFDIDEYVVDIARKDGLPDGMKPLPEGMHVKGAAAPLQAASLQFLTDETSANYYGERATQPHIHAATLDLVRNAREESRAAERVS